jgi:hypothetical protein
MWMGMCINLWLRCAGSGATRGINCLFSAHDLSTRYFTRVLGDFHTWDKDKMRRGINRAEDEISQVYPHVMHSRIVVSRL